jgi:protein-tyrosine phosphatase
MEIIDIHTHMLFGVDDGAADMETSLALLDKAYKEGTRRIFFTPHSIDGRFNFEGANRSLEKLVTAARERYPELKFSGGCELYYSESAVDGLLQGKVPTLADSKYVLVEFHPTVCYFDLKNAIQKLTVSGFIPIIAHAERYGCLRKESTEHLVELGAYIQLNARSVLGKSGLEPKQFCKKLLKSGLVHFIASDAHDLKRRSSGLSDCVKHIEKKYSQKYAERIFYKNPMKILNNTYI